MKFALVFLVILAVITLAASRTLDRCSLARELYNKYDISKRDLPIWTCIAEKESNYRTHVTGPVNDYDQSRDYGIFQINDRYWCQASSGVWAGRSKNGCGINCNALLSDSLSNSVRCAKIVLAQHGWQAWSTWKYCNGYLPSIDDCFRNEF